MEGTTYVEVKQVIWSKDSHGLFDYESKDVNFHKETVLNSSKVFKEGNNIKIKGMKETESQIETGDSKFLCSIESHGEKQDKFLLVAPDVQTYDSTKPNMFLIVRSLKNDDGNQKGYPLELGDILRLGRIEFKVLEYQDQHLKRHSLFDQCQNSTNSYGLTVRNCDQGSSGKPQCRICLMDEEEQNEILVNPCKCKGTGEYVHITCLQNWVNSKLKNKVSMESSSWIWKNLNCEVCKSPFPDMVEVKGKKMQLIPTGKPETPYILLERIFYDRSKGGDSATKMLILLSLYNDSHQIKLGRGHDCDLRENDISVSRLHAFIKYIDSKFVIFDNGSKFGTLILLKKGFEIEKKKVAVQLGRTVLTFALKQKVKELPKLKNPLVEEKEREWNHKKKTNTEISKIPQEFNLNEGPID